MEENRKETKIERNDLFRSYSITLNKEQCNGCGICVKICPKEAIKEGPASIENGTLVKKPVMTFDISKCVLCGECAVLCPLNALTMKNDKEEISTIVKNEAFPYLPKGIKVLKEKIPVYDVDFSNDSVQKTEFTKLSRCKPECETRCQKECPTEAIQVSVQRLENNQIERIIDVIIDESRCMYCTRCELACPFNAIEVKKPFQGTIELNVNLCPEGCTACQEICPSKAIKRESGKIVVYPQFCIFCSACQKICPEKAVTVQINQIFHTNIKAAAWLTALEKLASFEGFIKELRVEAGRRRVNAVERLRRHVLG